MLRIHALAFTYVVVHFRDDALALQLQGMNRHQKSKQFDIGLHVELRLVPWQACFFTLGFVNDALTYMRQLFEWPWGRVGFHNIGDRSHMDQNNMDQGY